MALLDLFSNKAARDAAKAQRAGYTVGEQRAGEFLDTGYGDAQGYLDRALALYDQYGEGSGQGFAAYLDALGLNGPEGTQRAQGMFTTSPGYQFTVDQAMQGAERAASAGGRLDSGNTRIALQDRGAQLASQEYGGWLDRLGRLGDTGIQVAGQQGEVLGGMATNATNLGTQKADYAWRKETGSGNAAANAELNRYNVGGNILGGLTLGAKMMGFGVK